MEYIENIHSDYVVYIHRNALTKVIFYVGMGNRLRPYEFKKRGIRWLRYVKKYGEPIVEIYKGHLSIMEAYNLEFTLIKTFGRDRYEPNGILINIAPGGINYTIESTLKAKKWPFIKKVPVMTNRGNVFRGRGFCRMEPYNVVYKFTEKGSRPAIYIWGGRKPASEETKLKIGVGNRGKTVSVESRGKMSATRKKLQLPAKKVIDNKTGIIYNSIGDAAGAYGYNMKTVSGWLTGAYKSDKNTFSYYAQ